MPFEGYMTTKEAAEYLGLSASYIRRLIAEGRLPATRPYEGARMPWLVKREDLEAFARDRKPVGNPDWIAAARERADDE